MDIITEIDDFLKNTEHIEEIEVFDKKINKYETELTSLKDEELVSKKYVFSAEDELTKLEEEIQKNQGNNGFEEQIASEKEKIHELETGLSALENRISEKDAVISHLKTEKEELIRKSLLNLHSHIKKEYKKVDAEHKKYLELCNQTKEKRYGLERELLSLKMLVYREYKLRLI